MFLHFYALLLVDLYVGATTCVCVRVRASVFDSVLRAMTCSFDLIHKTDTVCNVG